jgi:hypothetical protein
MMKVLLERIDLSCLFLGVLTPFTLFHSHATASTEVSPANTWTGSTPEQQGMQPRMPAEMMQHIHGKVRARSNRFSRVCTLNRSLKHWPECDRQNWQEDASRMEDEKG